MKIALADTVFKPLHKDYLGFPGTNPNIEIVSQTEADFVWYCAMGDGDDLIHDLRLLDGCPLPLISVTLGDRDYRDCLSGDNIKRHFSTATDDWERCVPYMYQSTDDPVEFKSLHACFVGSFKTNPARECLKPLASDDVLIEETDWWHCSDEERARIRIQHSSRVRRSAFSLCPRGIGRSSMRLVESILWGSIPIMIDDKTRLFGQDLGEFSLWSGMKTEDIKHALDEGRRMCPDEYIARVGRMVEFRNKYLLRDLNSGCFGTLGYTEYIRENVLHGGQIK